jgi:predicted nicotinamide N-methyase
MKLSLQQVYAGVMWIASSRCPTDALVLPRTRHHIRTQLPCSATSPSEHLLSPLTTGEPIRARTIPIQRGWNITIFEVDEPAAIVASYWDVFNDQAADDDELDHYHKTISTADATTTSSSNKSSSSPPRPLDPFGLVAWPGAVIAAQELYRHAERRVTNHTVLVLGAGCGVEALAAAQLGAKRVMATDLHPQTLELLSRAAAATSSSVITTQVFDITDHSIPLPNIDDVDLLIVADVLYNDDLAGHIARRIDELLISEARRSSAQRRDRDNVHILVTDSQRFVVDEKVFPVAKWGVTWETRTLASFCGSGVAVDEDQIYDATVRVLWITAAGGDGGVGGDHAADDDDMREDTQATTTTTTTVN